MKKIFLFILTVFFISVHFMRAIEYEEKTYCNPLNLDYGWGCFLKDRKTSRSAADPVIVLFKEKYYLFTTYDIGGYRVSDDLMTWKMYILIRIFVLMPLMEIIILHLQ